MRPRDLWPTHEGRVGIQLRDPPKSALAVKPCNLRPAPPACFICLERSSGSGDELGELLSPGCGCRGSAGRVHERCAVHAAAAEHARLAPGRASIRGVCPACKLPCGRAEAGARRGVVRACGRARRRRDGRRRPRALRGAHALSNALSASGRLASRDCRPRESRGGGGTARRRAPSHAGDATEPWAAANGQGKHREAAAACRPARRATAHARRRPPRHALDADAARGPAFSRARTRRLRRNTATC